MRRTTKALLTLAARVSMAATLAGVAAGRCWRRLIRPRGLTCCARQRPTTARWATFACCPPGVTTAPNAYSATIAVSKVGAVGPTVTFALTAGSLPPGLCLPAQSTSGAVITGNPTQTGTFNFTIKATDGSRTSTLAYQITVTTQGPPDQLQCNAANGSFLISGSACCPTPCSACPTRAAWSPATTQAARSDCRRRPPAGADPARHLRALGRGLGGTSTQQGIEPAYTFTVQGTGDHGQPLYQAYSITVDRTCR